LAEGIAVQLFELPLYEDDPDDEGNAVPRWVEHPQMGSKMDVAAMKVELLAACQSYLRTTINAPLIVWCSP
jgi:hypothetical protein